MRSFEDSHPFFKLNKFMIPHVNNKVLSIIDTDILHLIKPFIKLKQLEVVALIDCGLSLHICPALGSPSEM